MSCDQDYDQSPIEPNLIDQTLLDIEQMLYWTDKTTIASPTPENAPEMADIEGFPAARARRVWIPLWRAALLAGGFDDVNSPEVKPPFAGEAVYIKFRTPERRIAHRVARNVWIPVLRNSIARQKETPDPDAKPVSQVVEEGLDYLRSIRPIAEAGGLEYMVQAYNAGVPLEDIIA